MRKAQWDPRRRTPEHLAAAQGSKETEAEGPIGRLSPTNIPHNVQTQIPCLATPRTTSKPRSQGSRPQAADLHVLFLTLLQNPSPQDPPWHLHTGLLPPPDFAPAVHSALNALPPPSGDAIHSSPWPKPILSPSVPIQLREQRSGGPRPPRSPHHTKASPHRG